MIENIYQTYYKIYNTKYGYITPYFVFFICTISIVNIIIGANLVGNFPTVEELKEYSAPNPSIMIAGDDKTVLGNVTKANKEFVSFNEFPKHLVDALISTEDIRFYTHDGIDYRSMARVAVKSVLLGKSSSGGGSTITQQIAKNLYPREKFLVASLLFNKIKEWKIAHLLERTYSKEQLLNIYLNDIPFTDGCIGAPMAAKKFFSKSVKELNVQESALIVGMLAGNTRYNPRLNPDKALQRRNTVLHKMFKNRILSTTEYEKYATSPIELKYNNSSYDPTKYKYFRRQIIQKSQELLRGLKKENGEQYNIFTDNLRIYTTLDPTMQDLAEKAVAQNMSTLQNKFDQHWSSGKWWTDDAVIINALKKSNAFKELVDNIGEEKAFLKCQNEVLPRRIHQWSGANRTSSLVYCTVVDSIKYYYRQLNTGFSVMDTHSGAIYAWVGGIDYDQSSYDNITSEHQVGSTFKPIVYLSALEGGIKPCDYISNEQVAFTLEGRKRLSELTDRDKRNSSTWVPRNSDNNYTGAYSLQGALTHSVNVVTGNLMYQLSPHVVAQKAVELGLKDIDASYSMGLGTTSHSLLDMLKVYASFSSGDKIEPVMIKYITDAKGNIILDFKSINRYKIKPAKISKTNKHLMTAMLQSVIKSGTGAGMTIKANIAGKTGTTQNNADGWFIAYTPNIVVGTWVGGITPMVHFRDLTNGQASRTALPIVNTFMYNLYMSSEYSKIKNAVFEPLSLEEQLLLNCPLKIYRDDELIQDTIKQDSSLLNLY